MFAVDVAPRPPTDVDITVLSDELSATVLHSDGEFDDRYTLTSELGRGGFACVCRHGLELRSFAAAAPLC